MRYDSLLKPLSEAEPCGPDLDEMGDDAYLNYMLKADNQLPSRYLDFEKSADGVLFDSSTIDLRAEVKAISAFLEDSRDLRLLTLEARFQALSGNIVGFCECVQAIAGLVSTYWSEVHPKGYDGDFTLRQNAVSALDSRATVVTALEYAPIVRDQRSGTMTLRGYAVASGSAAPRAGERVLDVSTIVETIRSENNRAAIDAVHASVVLCRTAVGTIQSTFDEATGSQFSPDFDMLRGVLAKLKTLIELGRPDLGSGAQSGSPDAGDPDQTERVDAEGSAGRASNSGSAVLPSLKVDAATVTDRASAAAALLAAEQYFGNREPSSPALILVHQARLLVGQPLVVALDALMPESAEHATLVVDSAFGFEFSMIKMRAITDDYSSTANDFDPGSEEVPSFTAQSRQEAAALIYGVSAFFRSSEPSSPIPMLLGRAERFLNQNFQSIVADLIAKKTAAGEN